MVGTGCNCSCACAYVNQGGSDSADNDAANRAGGLYSVVKPPSGEDGGWVVAGEWGFLI